MSPFSKSKMWARVRCKIAFGVLDVALLVVRVLIPPRDATKGVDMMSEVVPFVRHGIPTRE
jgi:hypothetical protein